MKRIAIYCRVSSDDQKEKDTIDNQVDILNTYIEMKDDLEKYDEYLDDGVSGTIPFQERNYGKKLIEDAKRGLFDAILVWKIDRFGRDTLSGLSAVELLRQYNIEIISITEPFDLNTPTGRFQFITYLNMAELERNNILDRMFLGATRAAKQGKWLGGIVPYGYYVNKDKYLEINEDEAVVVRKIFDMYVNDNLSSLDIAVFLNSSGIDCNYASRGTGKKNMTEKKSLWSTSTIQRILRSPTYMGIHEYGKRASRRKETIFREVPAIIPEEVFEKATYTRKENIKYSKRNSPNRNFLLRTMIKCGECNRTYYGIYYKNRSAVYSCSGKKTPAKKLYGVKCSNINVNADYLENYIWDKCKEILINYDNYKVKDHFDDNKCAIEKEISILNSSLKESDLEKSNILKLYRKNIISEVELEEQLTDIKNESDRLTKLINSTKEKLEIYNNKTAIIKSNEKLVEHYKDRIDILSEQEKIKIIRTFIKDITVTSIIEHGEKLPSINITWDMSNLIFESSSIQRLSLTHIKKIPSYYISENLHLFYGHKLIELRLKNNLTKRDLSKALNISEKTLKHIEEGKIKNPYYYYYIYCRHFNLSSNIYLDFNLIKTNDLSGKLEFIKAFYGLKSLKDIDMILNLRPGSISEYINGKNKNSNIETRIENKVAKLKRSE